MPDVTIIGAGPAGISASLYARRANLDVLVLYHGKGNLSKASRIENYYGFPEGISGESLYKNGISQAENLGVKVEDAEVFHISLNDDMTFTVSASGKEILSKAVIIATGNKKLRPNIKGIDKFEGKGISYCAVCDAFFYRNKNVAVIGDGEFAVKEAENLFNVAQSVKIFTDGKDCSKVKEFSNGRFLTDDRKIAEIKGNSDDSKVEGLIFTDGSELALDGIFIALGEAGGSDFAKKLGLPVKDDCIIVNEKMETDLAGVFACGNSTGGLLQISKAVYQGALAGLSAAEYIRKLK